MSSVNSFKTRTPLSVGGRTVQIYSLRALENAGFPEIARLPFSLKILLENLLRHDDGRFVKAADVEALARWDVKSTAQREISFMPARVTEITGVIVRQYFDQELIGQRSTLLAGTSLFPEVTVTTFPHER